MLHIYIYIYIYIYDISRLRVKFTRLALVYTFLSVIFDIVIIKFVTDSIITIF